MINLIYYECTRHAAPSCCIANADAQQHHTIEGGIAVFMGTEHPTASTAPTKTHDKMAKITTTMSGS